MTALLLVSGCSDELPREAERRALCVDCDACEAWRQESCAYAERCGAEAERCGEKYAAIRCRSDQGARSCAEQLHEASCEQAIPDGCRPLAIADAQQAEAGCQQYRAAVCTSAVKCGYAKDRDACLAKPSVDCSRAVALSATFSLCLTDLAELRCDLWIPPDSCLGTVITTPR